MAVDFKCPHCGCRTTVDDRYAGQSGPCKQCGESVTIPGSQFATAPLGSPTVGKSSAGWVAVLAVVSGVAVVGLLGCGVLAAMLLPAVNSAREVTRRAQCTNNARQIGLALMNYESAYGTFPPAYVADEDGRPMHSWRVLVLPFLEENGLYSQYDFTKPWDSPENSAVTQYCPPVFQCPSDLRPQGDTHTSFLGISGVGMFFDGTTERKLRDIVDGTSNTMMVAESNTTTVHWSEPVDLDVAATGFLVGTGAPKSIDSSHTGGAVAVYADCSVRFLAAGTPQQQIQAECTIAAGD